MSKKLKKIKTRSSDSNRESLTDYEKEFKNNADLAEQWLKMLFPDLYSAWKLMIDCELTEADIIDYVYNIKIIKNHGYGHVQTTIFEGKITKIEALLRTIKRTETEKLLKL